MTAKKDKEEQARKENGKQDNSKNVMKIHEKTVRGEEEEN